MNVLNIALRKDAFEKLINGETNEIPIKKNDWWKKRLIDQETGVYKKFDTASVTCGSAEKFTYAIEKIELKGNKFIITVEPFRWIDNNGDIVEPGDSDSDSDFDDFSEELKDTNKNPELLEPTNVNPVTIGPDGSVTQTVPHILTEEEKQAIIQKYIKKVQDQLTDDMEENDVDVKTRVLNILDSFCENKDVFVVNMPNVTIRYNGQIVGYHGGRKLIADRDSDVRIDFKKHELVMMQYETNDDGFVKYINDYLDSMLKNNYVFINRKSSGFYVDANGELVFRIFAVSKKKYLFK